jgi:hypothetical protein
MDHHTNATNRVETHLNRRHCTGAILRIAVNAALLSVGFGGLAILNDAERGSKNTLLVGDGAWAYAVHCWAVSLQPVFCLGVLVELLVPLARRFHWSWNAILLGQPAFWCAVGAWMVWRIFALDDVMYPPKAIMVATGGGLLFYLGTSLHISLWQSMTESESKVHDFPFPWYLILVMLIAGFFGGHRGWTDISPVIQDVITYRDNTWKKSNKTPTEQRTTSEPWGY